MKRGKGTGNERSHVFVTQAIVPVRSCHRGGNARAQQKEPSTDWQQSKSPALATSALGLGSGK